jgi:hypothetical protein
MLDLTFTPAQAPMRIGFLAHLPRPQRRSASRRRAHHWSLAAFFACGFRAQGFLAKGFLAAGFSRSSRFGSGAWPLA